MARSPATNFLNFGPELDAVLRNSAAIVAAEGVNTTLEHQVLAALAVINNKLDKILAWSFTPPAATRIVPGLSADYRKGMEVNTELPNDVVRWTDIHVANAEGAFEPAPSGDTFTVTSSDPASLNAVIGTNPKTNNVARGINALVRAASNITVTVADSTGLTPWIEEFDIVSDAKPTQIVGDPTSQQDVDQPVPAS